MSKQLANRTKTVRSGGWVAVCLWSLSVLAFSGCVFDPSGRPAVDGDAQVPPDVRSDVVTLSCGDGHRDPGEPCDGLELGDETCLSLGYVGGALACTVECELDSTQCEIGGDCGNGLIEAPEICDGAELGGFTCSSEAGHVDGSLACTGQCTLDISDCHTCGNQLLEGPENCDGPIGGGRDCQTEGHTGGVLVCSSACQLDTSGCFDCGDGVCEVWAGEDRLVCPADCGWVAVDAGVAHTCAISADTTLWCWGANDAGQLGDSSLVDRDQPTFVPGLIGVVAVSAGGAHTCAVLDNGTVWCWGANDVGQLGDASTVDRTLPVQVVGLTNVGAVSAGGWHTCALAGQTLWCWGFNDKGQLGVDSAIDSDQPVPVSASTGLNLALSVTAGTKHTCAIKTDHTAWCWGDKGSGRIGDGANTDRPEPSPVDTSTGLTAVTELSAGEKHTCAVADNGAPWCWGHKGNGRIGDGLDTDQHSPVPVDTSTGMVIVVTIAAGTAHSCALDSAGTAWCWGTGGDGQIGDGDTVDQVVPEAVDTATGFTTASRITVGGLHTCGLKTDRTTWCWGANDVGQLGDGTLAPHESPEPIL